MTEKIIEVIGKPALVGGVAFGLSKIMGNNSSTGVRSINIFGQSLNENIAYTLIVGSASLVGKTVGEFILPMLDHLLKLKKVY